MQIGPFDIARGTEIPYEQSVSSPQKIIIAANGTVNVSNAGWSAKFFKIKFTASRQLAENVMNYIANGIQYAAHTFTYIDDYDRTWTVRFWGDELKIKAIASDLYECTMLLRKEI